MIINWWHVSSVTMTNQYYYVVVVLVVVVVMFIDSSDKYDIQIKHNNTI